MGGNCWISFYHHRNETVVWETAEAVIAKGMGDAAFIHIVTDDTRYLPRGTNTAIRRWTDSYFGCNEVAAMRL